MDVLNIPGTTVINVDKSMKKLKMEDANLRIVMIGLMENALCVKKDIDVKVKNV